MARRDEDLGAEERVRRSVTRTLGNLLFGLVLLVLAGAWAWLGFYQLGNGQAAIILRLGRHVDTVGDPGLKWHLPPPLETHEIVNVNEVVREEFGARDKTAGAATDEARAEAAMQTSDNNIVQLGFVVQYVVKDGYIKAVADDKAPAAYELMTANVGGLEYRMAYLQVTEKNMARYLNRHVRVLGNQRWTRGDRFPVIVVERIDVVL